MTSNAKLLLVDDEIELLNSGKKLLENAGFTVVTAQSGEQAVAILKEDEFDLAILDLNMTGISGHGVMDFINNEGINILVIVLSGETGFDVVSKAFS